MVADLDKLVAKPDKENKLRNFHSQLQSSLATIRSQEGRKIESKGFESF